MEQQGEWFAEWFNTPFYHRLYFNRNEKEAEVFIDKIIDYLKPPLSARMLDVACGKGRHSKRLADKGYDVTGIDIAPESIREASLLENDHLHFYVHDMRLPFLVNYFDFAFNFFTSFGYFKTQREHQNALKSISRSLKPGGVLLMDYLNSPYIASKLVPKEIKTIDSTTYQIRRWMTDNHFFKEITVMDPSLAQPVVYTEKVAAFSYEDFSRMFDIAGLTIKEVFGDYHFNEWQENKSPRLIMIAEKRQ